LRSPDENKLHDEVRFGQEAARFLNNTYTRRIFDVLRDQCHAEFAESQVLDDEARRQARLKLWGLEELIHFAQIEADTGKMAEEQLAQLEKQKDAPKA